MWKKLLGWMLVLFTSVSLFPATAHEAWPVDRVEEYILSEAGGQFDPQVVDAFRATREAFRGVAASAIAG